MKILLAVDAVLPVRKYGGTERVVYSLGKALADMGHDVTFLCGKGSTCGFAKIIERDPLLRPEDQVPESIDISHFNNYIPSEEWGRPYVVTFHGNGIPAEQIVPNSIFVSRDHARRHGCESWVYNGLDWDDYPTPDLNLDRAGFHFLGNAAWRVKNVRGAIDAVKSLRGETLEVLGGKRFNFKMGVRFTFNPRIHFHGMVDNEMKARYIERSNGLVFPVTWHEPFGLCIVESLYFGAPVFATPYGSLPELVGKDVGFLTADSEELKEAMNNSGQYNPLRCHEYARDCFDSKSMAQNYLRRYEKVLAGEKLITTPPVPLAADYRHLPWK
ncbi:MAG: glycosyltransferase family 4 protein [Bacteroides sp.]|nr:glycosyltransferase family 4 protein [Bacteroides sp.]